MQHLDHTYKRGQLEWALWQLFVANRPSPGQPPQAFLTRIKRLWELDRQMGAEGPGYAFFDEAPVGRGYEVGFRAFNGFCLAIGLDLLDAGYKQAEVVTLLRHIRPLLAERYREIEACPPAPPDLIAAEDRPDCPSYSSGGLALADCRVFMVLQKVELTEVHGVRSGKARPQAVQFYPVFCRGIEALTVNLDRMSEGYRKALVLEIAEMAAILWEYLEKAPLIKRGRK
jgi:hypothetical protein